MTEKIEIDIKDEDLTDVNDFTPEELESDDADWKAKATERTGIAKRRTTQLKKAKEAIEAYKAQVVELTQKPKLQDKKGLDYAQKGYLKSSGIEEEFFGKVEEALESFGGNKDGNIEKVLNNPYFKSELETWRAEKASREASPVGGGSGGQSGGQKSVNYWVKKGGFPPADGTEETTKLRGQIVERRKELDRLKPEN